MLLGTIFVACGALWLIFIDMSSSYMQMIGIVSAVGFGMGCISTPAIVTIQNAAAVSMRGVATSTNSLMGALGQTVAVAVFGMLFNRVVSEETPTQMADGMHLIFIAILVVAVIKIIVAQLLPSGRKSEESQSA